MLSFQNLWMLFKVAAWSMFTNLELTKQINTPETEFGIKQPFDFSLQRGTKKNKK